MIGVLTPKYFLEMDYDTWLRLRKARRLIIVSIAFFLVSIFVCLLIPHSNSNRLLFTPYADIFPGQHRQAFEARDYRCSYIASGQEYCFLPLESNDFSRAEIGISNDVVTHTIFMVHDGAVRVGDLEVMLGHPEQRGRRYMWANGNITAVGNTRSSLNSCFAPVQSIVLVRSDQYTLSND